jgi:hypothetical protein
MPLPKLHYAPQSPADRHRRRLYRLIVILCSLSIVSVAYLWCPVMWSRVQLIYWQHRCLVNEFPPGQPIFDQAANRSNIPVAWSNFYALLSPPGFRSAGTLFLHKRTTADGKSWLIALDLVHPPGMKGFAVVSRTIACGDLFNEPREKLSSQCGEIGANGSLVVRTATVDPDDPSRLDVQCIDNGTPLTIAGHVESQGNGVQFQLNVGTSFAQWSVNSP